MKLFSFLFVSALLAKLIQAQKSVAIEHTPSGRRILGVSKDGVDAFLGIKYATVGERFSRSTLLHTTSELNATAFGPNCHQGYPGMPSFLHQPRTEAEECLYLNIWRPTNISSLDTPPPRVPIMVWIHGGGFMVGSGADLVHNGANLVRSQGGVMVITLNYRLGALGFLPQNENDGFGAMNGLYDQIVALQWIQSNAPAFGGDPNQVTLFGESAGSESICMLSVSPLTQGLFQRAIMQSGDCMFNPWMRGVPNEDIHFALASVDNLKNAMGVPTLEDLKNASLVDGASLNYMSATVGWSLVVLDREILPEHPRQLYSNRSNIVPRDFLVGSNSREDVTFMMVSPNEYLQLAQYGLNDSIMSLVGSKYGREVANQALTAYDAKENYGDDSVAAYSEFHSDWYIGCPSRAFASRVSALAQGEVFLYHFAHFAVTDPVVHYGLADFVSTSSWASHMAQIPFIFGTLNFWDPSSAANLNNRSSITITEEDCELSREIMTRWTNFAKTGNPNIETEEEKDLETSVWDPLPRRNSEGTTTATSHLRESRASTSSSNLGLPVLVFESASSQMEILSFKEQQCATYPFAGAASQEVSDNNNAPEPATENPTVNDESQSQINELDNKERLHEGASSNGMSNGHGARYCLGWCFLVCLLVTVHL